VIAPVLDRYVGTQILRAAFVATVVFAVPGGKCQVRVLGAKTKRS